LDNLEYLVEPRSLTEAREREREGDRERDKEKAEERE